MTKARTASGTVHWVGSGLSTGSGVRFVCDHADRVVMWARTRDKALTRLRLLGLDGRATPAEFSIGALRAQAGPGDVVVSMLPATEHAGLLRLCVAQRAHFACSSYTSPDLAAVAQAAERAGAVVLTEAGLDPGIDHLLAHKLVSSAISATGDEAAVVDFSSYCGGLPVVAGEFRYQFTWAPRAVLAALCEPARYIAGGVQQSTERPWEATRELHLSGEAFEAYPNRDSVPFAAQYGLPPSWQLRTFIRGTLRLSGWLDAWAPIFAELSTGNTARIAELADELAVRYPPDPDSPDRVVLAVSLDVHRSGQRTWSGQYLLDTTGDQAESAMARCVSLPLAFGVTEILAGKMTAGLHMAAADAPGVDRWLAFLADHDISVKRTQ